MLRDAIADLGPGALTRLRQTAAADPIFNQSDSGGLPLAYDAPLDSTIEELEEWSRGGRWLIRLEALRQLALVESRQIKSLIKGGGSGVFPNALRKGEQRELIQSCLNQLQDWGVDAGSALLMARGIYAAYYGRKLRAPHSSGWGRKTLADLLSTPKG